MKTETTNSQADTIILSEGRGDYITGIKWQHDGKAEIMGGNRENAIRYTTAEAQEVIEALTAANGRGYNMLAIFSGPSDAQAKEAEKKADIEAEYMRWLYAEGKGSDLATCETKYAQINLTRNQQTRGASV